MIEDERAEIEEVLAALLRARTSLENGGSFRLRVLIDMVFQELNNELAKYAAVGSD